MTQAEKIEHIIKALEIIELAIVSNDRQKQLEFMRKLREIREELNK